MLTIEDLKDRQKGLGGSDIAAVLGLSPYKTPYELYLEKTAPEPIETRCNEAMKWGVLLEDSIAYGYQEQTGNEVEKCGEFLHPHHPIFFAHPDRLLSGNKKGLEIKNVSINASSSWGPSGSNIIPENYFMQISHYMYVTGFSEWDVAALIGGNTLRIYTFHHNKAFDEIIEESGLNFWKNHVEPRIPPEVSFSSSGKDILRKYHADIEQKTVVLPEDYLHWKKVYAESNKLAKEYSKSAEIASNHILEGMKDAQRALLPDGSCFSRKKISVSGYSIEPREYVRLDFKEFRNNNTLLEAGA